MSGNRVPFLVNTTMCWRGYEGTWSLVDGKLWLDNLAGYIAKGPLVEIADAAFRHFREYDIDLENPSMCSRITLEDIFPGAESSVFAHWFSGEINASLSDEIMRNGEGDDASVKRTLKLVFQDGVLTSEDVVLKFPLTRGEIESGLTSPDASVRLEFAKSKEYTRTPAQIERGLQDEDSQVRVAFISPVRETLTPAQLERAMADECADVRWYANLFENCEPTPSQLERALKDESPNIRCKMAHRFADHVNATHARPHAVGNNRQLRVAFGFEKPDRLGNTLGGFGEGRRIGVALGIRRQDRHLDRQGGETAVSQLGAQGADHAPVGVNPHAMDHNGRLVGILRWRKQGQKLVMSTRRLQVNRVSHHQAGYHFVGPFLFTGVIGCPR